MNKGQRKKIAEILELAADNIFCLLDVAEECTIEITLRNEESGTLFFNQYEFDAEPNNAPEVKTDEKVTHAGSGCCGFHECIYNGA